MLSFAFARLGCRGAVTLEFGLVAVPFLALLFGGIEMGRYLHTVEALHNHADATLRAAVVYVGNDVSNRCLTDLSNAITRPPLPAGLAAARLTVARPSCSRNDTTRVITISVSASYHFSFVAGLLGLADQKIDRVVQQAL
ncbi:TadE/TadG family type IV pilus assembly protein [Roseomonas xinghualingensis]|uniref:TadE/TadG family type IV pilus assembly protein n=1 Tax=Roseomonas xinghualingensis TaxID=2986475 RepID=UPI0021F22E0C|nr:TadE/TadG family type IV pilus assembly protein [Roseomonas sp. SXEYE001]MCV4208707.1 pilus assembly protein [Roseomonas sp. SXEYE001]